MKKKIAVLFPAFMGGGAESVCAWMLEALKDGYDVTLFTLTNCGLKELNTLYGTSLTGGEIKIRSPFPAFLTPLIRLIFSFKGFQKERQRLLASYFKRFAAGFDLAISAYNEMEMGKAGLQYLHWMNVTSNNFSGRQNISIANSGCTAKYLKDSFGVSSPVIYPPVVGNFPHVAWNDKEDGFVCVGRLSAAKGYGSMINIVQKLRAKGHKLHLHIIGTPGNFKYMRYLRYLQRENREWLFIEVNVTIKRLHELLSGHKYGIHWKQEPFGIVVAEMMKAGCIPFVRSAGGQVEIVGENSAITFMGEDEAVRKITAVLSNSGKQQELLSYLAPRKELFSEKKFMEEFRKAVAERVESRGHTT